jgi:hypothetical protein
MTRRTHEIHPAHSRAAMTAVGGVRYGASFEAGLLAPHEGARQPLSAAERNAAGSARRPHVTR